MKTIVVPIPDLLKDKLDVMRTRGYTINGFVRAALATALAAVPTPTDRVTLRYRKPHGQWRTRTVPARQVERTILRLEDQGAEILPS